MEDGMENAPDYTIPSLPPFLGVAPLVHDPVAGDGQVWPLGSTGTAAAQALTPLPPQRIIMPAGSAISSITNIPLPPHHVSNVINIRGDLFGGDLFDQDCCSCCGG